MKLTHRKRDMQEMAKQGISMQEIGKKFGITRQRVHQILTKGGGVLMYVPEDCEVVKKSVDK